MIERLVSADCADRRTLQGKSNFDLRLFYEEARPLWERHRVLVQRADRRIHRIKKQKEDAQKLWEWSCARIKRTGLPKDDYPFPSRAVASWLIKIKEELREQNQKARSQV
jgi:hypothetical protein